MLVFSQIPMKTKEMMSFFLTKYFNFDKIIYQKRDARKSTSRNSADAQSRRRSRNAKEAL